MATTTSLLLNALNVWELAALAVSLLSAAVSVSIAIWIFYKKEKRFITNVQKPIVFFNLSKDPHAMETEARSLKKNGLFSEPTVTTDVRSTSLIDTHSLVAIGVDEETDISTFQTVYNRVIAKGKPVIIYTLGARNLNFIRANDPYINTYLYHTISTTPLRFVSDIFTVLATFPE